MIRRLYQTLTRYRNPVATADLLRTEPISRTFGLDRGTPIDRYYIDGFIARHHHDIKGCVVEIGDDRYTRRFGLPDLTEVRILNPGNKPGAGDITGDLTAIDGLPEGIADCLILTQTLNFIYDLDAAVAGCVHLLKPGGVVLGSVAGVTQISRYDADRWGDYWRFTAQSLARLLDTRLVADITLHGNVLAAHALLDGIAVEDLPNPRLLDDTDHDYPVTLTFRACRKI